MSTQLDLDGVQVHPVWVGSAVTGWLFTCDRAHRSCGLGYGAPYRPGRSETFDSETEANERAGDHWNRHQQET